MNICLFFEGTGQGAEGRITNVTRRGLTYTFSEGTALDGMTQKATKVGDGTSWTPTIAVKGGASGFYSIGVTK